MKVPDRCPSCEARLHVVELHCDSCGTKVQGNFENCRFCRLHPEDRGLLELFLHCRGNLKEVQRALGSSYPTVRSKIDKLWQNMKFQPEDQATTPDSIVAALREGKMSVEEAELKLRHLTNSE